MEDKKYVVVEQDIIKTEAGEILTVVDPGDIMIVKFNDGFFDVEEPIYANALEDYHTPISLLKERPDGLYEKFNIKQGE